MATRRHRGHEEVGNGEEMVGPAHGGREEVTDEGERAPATSEEHTPTSSGRHGRRGEGAGGAWSLRRQQEGAVRTGTMVPDVVAPQRGHDDDDNEREAGDGQRGTGGLSEKSSKVDFKVRSGRSECSRTFDRPGGASGRIGNRIDRNNNFQPIGALRNRIPINPNEFG
ncbi:hypothetical protein SCHPADRAFT_894894 [Schizopora paradoxa]|uniref:Uncharacterized protein n=1 Tax=Schizopora paradoxa TaxID=27342 RepID=A0A0H2R5K9_9AGAM|nr:hypothetical protein SCHPADRAFT_894894 [Schizopora paradoxa]